MPFLAGAVSGQQVVEVQHPDVQDVALLQGGS